jgi:hypothetical protein
VTLSIFHTRLEDGTWIAVCDMFPAWSFTSPDMDQVGARKSLKRYMARNVVFAHHGWDGVT